MVYHASSETERCLLRGGKMGAQGTTLNCSKTQEVIYGPREWSSREMGEGSGLLFQQRQTQEQQTLSVPAAWPAFLMSCFQAL